MSHAADLAEDTAVEARGAGRYAGADELGRFVARFSTVLNLADLVFLVFVAGFLLRRFAVMALKADIGKRYLAELGWTHTFGGTYNNARDRDFLAVAVGARF